VRDFCVRMTVLCINRISSFSLSPEWSSVLGWQTLPYVVVGRTLFSLAYFFARRYLGKHDRDIELICHVLRYSRHSSRML